MLCLVETKQSCRPRSYFTFFILVTFISVANGFPRQSVARHAFNRPALAVSLRSDLDPYEAPGDTQGWTSSPDGRGTIDIIWSCLLTVFLCAWTSICVNVPPLGASPLGNFWRKLLVFFETLAGPEFIFHTAIGEYVAARRSVRVFKDAGFEGWTIRHGFFANMGGFVLDARPSFVPFPLNVSQLHYLVTHGYVDYEKVMIKEEEVEDKNKFDTLTRIVTVVQLFWFAIDVLARVALGMALTTLELSTIGFIFCTVSTAIFWRQKPQDVSYPILLEPNVPLCDILTKAGQAAAKPYSYTPMDFASSKPHMFQGIWRYCFRIPERVGFYFHSPKRLINKMWDDNFPELTPWADATLAVVQLGFAAIHVAGWNFHYPTDIERALWRTCTLFILCSMFMVWIILSSTYIVLPLLCSWLERQHRSTHPILLCQMHAKLRNTKHYQLMKRVACCKVNNSPNKTPDEDIPLITALLLIPLGVLYVLARMFIIVEDIINFRSLPPSVYASVDWTAFLPHF
ncbi:hypothetical protein F4821DRAFT_279561 [Hypoxylon rubiginosum]|uniref:Uncharacterized protein n=1 Tax=Hypoxylon rubiginosum TaxID=110542 RepID=A0ACC0DI16_9PEZI|nr:hypothetical protein F4821DRAFT_279561 [Hypoxylon rubiginosum]